MGDHTVRRGASRARNQPRPTAELADHELQRLIRKHAHEPPDRDTERPPVPLASASSPRLAHTVRRQSRTSRADIATIAMSRTQRPTNPAAAVPRERIASDSERTRQLPYDDTSPSMPAARAMPGAAAMPDGFDDTLAPIESIELIESIESIELIDSIGTGESGESGESGEPGESREPSDSIEIEALPPAIEPRPAHELRGAHARVAEMIEAVRARPVLLLTLIGAVLVGVGFLVGRSVM